MMQLNISQRGEVVIPKKIRDQLGFSRQQKLLLVVNNNEVVLRPARSDEEIIRRWGERARQLNLDVSKWVYGDRLYEEGFAEEWAGKLSKLRGKR